MTTTVNTAAPAYINAADNVLTDGEAWVPLSTTVLTGAVNSFTLESSTGANDWSQYMDLVLIINARNDYGDVANAPAFTITARFNDDGGTNYPWQRFYSNGSTAVAQSIPNTVGAHVGYATAINDADVFNGSIAYFSDINSGKYKSIFSQSANATNDSSYNSEYTVGVTWENVAAITKMVIYSDSGSGSYDFCADSRFDLFGILPRMVTA